MQRTTHTRDTPKVLSWPAPCDGPDPKLMFQFKGRVGYIPSSFISGQVRLPPGGTACPCMQLHTRVCVEFVRACVYMTRECCVVDDCTCVCVWRHTAGRLGRITRIQTEEEIAGREDALHVLADDIIVIPKIPPAEVSVTLRALSLSLSRSCLALRRTTRTGGWARSSTPKTTPSSLATKVGLSSPLSSQTLVRARMAVLNRCATSCRPTRSAAIQCGEDPHHPPTHDRRARASVVLILVVSDDSGKQLGDHHQPAIATGSQADTTFLPRALSLRFSVLRLCR
jgi:hypothetical protein